MPGAFRWLKLLVLDPYDIALTKLQRDSDRDDNDVLYFAQTVPFDLELLKARYHAELRPYVTGDPKICDLTLELWIAGIMST